MKSMRLTVSRALVPSHSKVDSDTERDHYWTALLALWNASSSSSSRAASSSKKKHNQNAFPGCNPMSLSRAHLREHVHDGYVITLKSDGVRYALFLTLRPSDGSPIALMVDRSKNMYEVEVVAEASYFERGTLLEGELVWKQPDETKLLYLVFDAICVRGQSLLHLGFVERLQAADKCTRLSEELAALIQPSSTITSSTNEELQERVAETEAIALVHFDPPVSMRPKCFVGREHASKLWADRADTEHRVDGLILYDSRASYVSGTATNGAALKWKEHSTVDLEARFSQDPSIGSVTTDDRGTVLHTSDGPLASDLIPGRTVRLQPSGRVQANKDGEVLEYLVTLRGEHEVLLFPIRKRPDKSGPNSAFVVHATIRDVIEGITPDELTTGGGLA